MTADPGSGRPSIRTGLAGRHLLLTGVTGFVGEALLQRLLTDVPDVRLTVLVRPRGSTPGAARVEALLGRSIFAAAVERAGGVAALMAERVATLEGDLSDPPELPTDFDAVVHCAGDVSFDPPVDVAFRTNVVGVRRLLARVEEASAAGGRDIHYLHVSTAYVAGRRRGAVFEESIDHQVDVDSELAWGLAQGERVEVRSRDAGELARMRRKAEREHGRAGMMAAAAVTEETRRQWVKDELVRIGTERARSLGWTDCYTFTKALGERVVEAHAAAGRRVTIYRPSIIESALERPYPGWIEGFKMAEPLILAYGRGELALFPGAADTTIDIVPVDHVVASIIACLAHPPEPGEPAYVHMSSGHRNPVTFGMVYDHVRAYFQAEPFAGGQRGHARLPAWTWPGSVTVERFMRTGERAHRAAERLVAMAPRSDRTIDWARRLDRQGKRLAFMRRYLDLYREYAEAQVRFVDDNTQALFASLTPEDREVFGFDTATIDWRHYLQDVHCPAVTKPIRDLDQLRSAQSRPDPSRLQVLEPAPTDADVSSPVAAFFDMDGTLLSSNVVESYLWMRLAELSTTQKVTEAARMAARLPKIVQADRHDRTSMLRVVYREYAGARLSDLDAIVDAHLAPYVLERLAPDAVRRIRQHRAAGHTTVLITGALRPLTRPLAALFDHVEAADLSVDDRGRCTGHLTAPPLIGEARAAFVRDFGGSRGLDLSGSFAYADSYSDLPLLEAVGHPVAVRPEIALFRHARKKHWNVVDWAPSGTSHRMLDPARVTR